ncbi:MAG TPA: extracellular solute-binding protein [Anaerolineales bacterium]
MKTHILWITQLSLVLLLAGCSSLAPLLASHTPTPAPAFEATSTPQIIPTSTASAASTRRLLRVWLPPRYDPEAGTPTAELFKQRLLDFEDEYPGIQLEVRVKSETDILNALSVTNKAAPENMPDLIALSYSDMHIVGSAGFLHPLDGLTTVLQDPDWYAFARELGHLQNTEYGIPFASDVLLSVYRPSVFTELPSSWDALFESGTYMVYSVSDPMALFSLSLYLSEGAELTNDIGAVTLNEETLVRLLSFHKRALETETALPAIRDYQTDLQSLQYYRDGRADLAVVWASSDLQTRSGDYLPLLSLENTHYSLGTGWVWALAGSSVENQPLAVELASYLVESSFMSEWTRISGYLPTRPQALDGWEDDELEAYLNEVLQSAHPIPSEGVISVVGPLIQGALVRIFKGEQPDVVARSVIESLK